MTTSYDYTSSARKKTPPGKETSVEKPAAAEATPPPAPAAPAKPQEKPKFVAKFIAATKPEEKPPRVDPEKKTKKFLPFVKIITLIVIGWVSIWYIDQFAQKEFAQYAMRPWAISMIVTLAVICAFIVTGFFIKAVKPTTNKSIAYAVILGIFFLQMISIGWQEARRDYYDPHTGEPSVWVTDGLQEFWFEKPDFVFSPITGKPVRLATREDIPKLPKWSFSFDFFKKEPPPPPPPPPTWKTVFEKEYIGIGFAGGDGGDGCILTAQNGSNYDYGYKIVVTGEQFEVWYNGAWQKAVNNRFEYINQSTKEGTQVGVRAPQGKIFQVMALKFF